MSKKKLPITLRVGRLVLTFDPQPEGGYVISSPFDPALLTQSDTIEEGIENAFDAAEALQAARADLRKTTRSSKPTAQEMRFAAPSVARTKKRTSAQSQ